MIVHLQGGKTRQTAASPDSHVVRPRLQHCCSASHPPGWIHLGHAKQAGTLVGVLELGGGCSAALPPRGTTLGGRAACVLPSPDLVTGYRCPMAKRRRPHDLGKQKFERRKEEREIQRWAWQVTLGALPPPRKRCLCTREGQGCLLCSLVARQGLCTPQSWTRLVSTHAAASSQSETIQWPRAGRPLGLGGLLDTQICSSGTLASFTGPTLL